MSEDTTIKVYVRNSHKMGKILDLQPTISIQELYSHAAASQSLQSSEVRLYLKGKLIPCSDGECSLKQKDIIHLVNLTKTSQEEIEVKVRMLEGSSHPTKIRVSSSSTIRDFIDHKISKVYGVHSDKLVLVCLGRQLKMDQSLRDGDIQDQSQIFCVNVEELRAKRKAAVGSEQINHNLSKNQMYPSPNFPLQGHKEINANNKMDLIYDASIHRSSSLPDHPIQDEQVIQEEQETNTPEAEEESKKKNQVQKKENEEPEEEEKPSQQEMKKQPQIAQEEEVTPNAEVTPAEEQNADGLITNALSAGYGNTQFFPPEKTENEDKEKQAVIHNAISQEYSSESNTEANGGLNDKEEQSINNALSGGFAQAFGGKQDSAEQSKKQQNLTLI